MPIKQIKHVLAPMRTAGFNKPHLLSAWVKSPLKIGAVIPSSRALSDHMAVQVDLSVPGVIIELGAGTGVVTHALLNRGVPPERLLVLERDPHLFSVMQMHFPKLNIIRADAMELGKILGELKIREVAAIVSSLPLVSMNEATRHTIELQMAQALSPQGRLIQYTYAPRSPIALSRLRSYGLYGKRVKFVVGNMPPAHVWLYRRERRSKIHGVSTKR